MKGDHVSLSTFIHRAYNLVTVHCSFTDLINVTKLDIDLTSGELHSLQNIGTDDLLWVEIGVTGVGKSTLGNFLLGKGAFEYKAALMSVTDRAEVNCSAVNEQRVCIVDTPGFGHTGSIGVNSEAENWAIDMIVELSKTMLMARHGIHAFLVVVRADNRDLSGTKNLLDQLDILENYWNHSILVFTHGNEFDKASEEKQYEEFEAMLKSPRCPTIWLDILEKVSQRYVIVESVEWKDDEDYRVRKLMELRNHSSSIVAKSGLYSDTLQSLAQEYIESAKLEFSDMDSQEAQVDALQAAFRNIMPVLLRLIHIRLSGTKLLMQKMAAAKEDIRKQKDVLYNQLLKEQKETRSAQAEERAKEEERKAKEREMAMAEKRRLALERDEKARKELEEYLKKPTFAERRIETRITKSGFYAWQWKYSAEAVDVATGIRVKARNYESRGCAKEHAS